jgi:hypothetical protein
MRESGMQATKQNATNELPPRCPMHDCQLSIAGLTAMSIPTQPVNWYCPECPIYCAECDDIHSPGEEHTPIDNRDRVKRYSAERFFTTAPTNPLMDAVAYEFGDAQREHIFRFAEAYLRWIQELIR